MTTPTGYLDFNPRQRDFRAPVPFWDRLRASLLPPVYTLGVDLSHWNSAVDFKALKAAGYEFAILKATEGVDLPDSAFAARWPQALAAGLVVGTYHFFRSNVDGAQQAGYHLAVTEPLRQATGGKVLPPTLDVETADGVSVGTRVVRIRGWCDRVWGELGVNPLVYSSPYLWSTLTGNMVLDCIGWVAHWTSYATPSWPAGWPAIKRKFWQFGVYPLHNWAPLVPGCVGEVDVNRFYGTPAELRAMVGITDIPENEKVGILWDAHPELH